MKKTKRIPTFIGLVLVILSIGAGILAINQSSSWFLRAEPQAVPKQIKTTNITDTGFSVSWVTDKPVVGSVIYGEEGDLNFTAYDDRDEGGSAQYSTHHITLKGLKAETNYLFKIICGDKTFDDNGQPYQSKTGPEIFINSPPSDVAYGEVIKPDETPTVGAIIYLSLPNTITQSTLTKSNGSWMIPLNLARSDDLKKYASYDKQASTEEVFVQAGEEGTATAIAATSYDSPLPPITLGQSHDFRKPLAETNQMGDDQESANTPPSEPGSGGAQINLSLEDLAGQATPPPDLTTPSPEPETKSLAIINPIQDESINSFRPAILGTAPPGKVLNITVESPTAYSGTVTVNTSGNWQWSPPENLEPGEHTITASYTDEGGQVHSVTRSFVVLAASDEGLPSFEASPSSETTTPSPTSAPTATRTPTPVTTLAPTTTASPSPTATPASIGRTALPSTESGIPESGYLTPTFLVLIMGFSLIGLSFFARRFLSA